MTSGRKKVSVQDLTEIISEQAEVSKKFSEGFLRELIDVIAEYLERDGVVKVKGLGTFKLTWVDGRRSVDVSTGNEIVLPAHYKVGFTPETAVKQAVNEPYSHLSTVVTEIPDDLGGDDDKGKDNAVGATVTVSKDSESERPSVDQEQGQVLEESAEAQPSSEYEEARHVQQDEDADQRFADVNVENENSGKHGKNALWIVVAITVVCLFAAFFFSYDVRFSFYDVDNADLVVDEHPLHTSEDDNGGVIMDLSYDDSIDEDIVIVEEYDSVQEILPSDPFETYTYETALNAPVREYVTVIDGSRLTMVAYRAFGSKDFWVYVYDANRDVLKNPAEVEKGMKLKIPVLDSVLTDPMNPKAIQKARELGKSY